jgi:hypothetical protein
MGAAAIAPVPFEPAYAEPDYSEPAQVEQPHVPQAQAPQFDVEQAYSAPVSVEPEVVEYRTRKEAEYRPLVSGGAMAEEPHSRESHAAVEARTQVSSVPVEKYQPIVPGLDDFAERTHGREEEIPGEGHHGTAPQTTETSIVFSSTHGASSAQLVQAEEAWKKSDQAMHEAKRLLDQSLFQLNLAHSKEEKASADLHSAQQEMTTAYQFAAVAAQRQHDAAQYFRRATRWTTAVAALSWVAMAWVAWVALPQRFPMLNLPIWAPGIATVVIVVVSVLVANYGTREQAE